MERLSFENIKCGAFGHGRPYNLRYSRKPNGLTASIRQWGVLRPVLAAPAGSAGFHLLDGHMRFEAVRELGQPAIPAMILNRKLSPKECLVLALVSNWSGEWSEMDRALTLRRAVEEMGFSKQEAAELLLPVLGIEGGDKLIERYLEVWRTDSLVQDMIDGGRFPLRCVSLLLKFSPGEQSLLINGLFPPCHFSVSQIKFLLEGLRDLSLRNHEPVSVFLKQPEILKVLNHPSWDEKMKAQRIYDTIRKKLHPRTMEKQLKFDAAAGEYNLQTPEVSVDVPVQFEDEGYVVKAHLRRRESLEAVIRYFNQNKEPLNSLFDIIL